MNKQARTDGRWRREINISAGAGEEEEAGLDLLLFVFCSEHVPPTANWIRIRGHRGAPEEFSYLPLMRGGRAGAESSGGTVGRRAHGNVAVGFLGGREQRLDRGADGRHVSTVQQGGKGEAAGGVTWLVRV